MLPGLAAHSRTAIESGVLMKLTELQHAFTGLVAQAKDLVEMAGYSWEERGFDGVLNWDRDDREAYYFVNLLQSVAGSFCFIDERLEDASRPPKAWQGRLRRLANGRYGYEGPDGRIVEMYCGRRVEALVDFDGRSYWMACTIEYTDGDYYLTRFNRPLEGLLVREPR